MGEWFWRATETEIVSIATDVEDCGQENGRDKIFRSCISSESAVGIYGQNKNTVAEK